MEGGSKGIVIGTFIANLMMSGSLSLLWGMINALQIISHLPYFNVYMPANAQIFYTFMNNISNFDVIPTDSIFQWLGLGSEEDLAEEF